MYIYFDSYDEGTIMIKVGREEPAISMDVNGGKIIWAKHSEMQQVNLKALPEGMLFIQYDKQIIRKVVKQVGLNVINCIPLF